MVGILTNPVSKNYFNNGLHQNAYFLYKTLEQIPSITPILVYPGALMGPDAPETTQVFGVTAHRLSKFETQYHLDALLLVSAVVDGKYLQIFKDRGVKIAAVVYGNRYVMDMETTVFGYLEGPGGLKNHSRRDFLREDVAPDAERESPHFAWQKDYIQHRYQGARSYVCPYIWHPVLLDLKYYQHPKFGSTPTFTPGKHQNKKMFCTEPNLNVLKTSFFPVLAADLAYKSDPENSFEHLYLYNAQKTIKYNDDFASYMGRFSSVQDRKISFRGRTGFPTMTKSAQILFHHHFQNGLNYTMLEAAHLRLPVVHNSEWMPALGYYYDGANITDAARQIHHALGHEDRDDLEDYNAQCQKTLDQFSISNIENVKGYHTLLMNLLDSKYEPELPAYIQSLDEDTKNYKGYLSPLI
jgi:hypothetical protein